jgi:hypothetical protein
MTPSGTLDCMWFEIFASKIANRRRTYALARKVVLTEGIRCYLGIDFHSWNSHSQQLVVELSFSFHYVLLDASGSSSSLHQILEEGETYHGIQNSYLLQLMSK